MSLTATLLHSQLSPEILFLLIKALPKGRRRTHRIDDKPIVRPAKQPDIHWRTKTTSPENCERTHAAIAAGCRTVSDIQQSTDLGKTTIWRAIVQLESCPTGPRIMRTSDKKPIQFATCHA